MPAGWEPQWLWSCCRRDTITAAGIEEGRPLVRADRSAIVRSGLPGPDGPGSSEELLPAVYDELRRLARARLSREPDGLTLQPTALVHEDSTLASSPDGLVVVGSADGRLQSWQWTGDALVPRFDISSTQGEVLRVAIHGDRLAVAHRSRTVLLRRPNGALVDRLETTTDPFVVAFSPDGRQLGVGTWTGIVELWDPRTAERTLLTGHTRVVTGLDFSSDGTLLVSASHDGTVRLWDATTRRSLATVASRDAGAALGRFVTQEHLVVGFDNGELETIDLGYFFRHVAGQAEYQRQLRERLRGSPYPRGGEVLAWSRETLERQ
jgi:WD40 repeat protein